MTRACTLNEPNIVATMGWHAGMFPPGKTGRWPSRVPWRTEFAAAHRVAVETIRAGAPGVPVGLTLSMTDYQLTPGGEEKLESIRHHAEDVFLDATDGDDFLGVQVYTRMLIGPDGWAGYEDGVPILDMGYEFYPASLGNCLRRAWDYTGGCRSLCSSPRTGSAPPTTRSASTTSVRPSSGVLRGHRRRSRRAGLHLLVAARQLRVGAGLPAEVRHRRASTARRSPGRPSRARPGWRRSRRRTRSTPEVESDARPAPCWPRWRR